MVRIGFVIVLIALAVFIVLDRPVETVRSLADGEPEENQIVLRQSLPGLSLFLSRDERREGRRVAVINADWLYCYPPTGEVYLVPRGYQTDFASIPGFARIIVSPFGDHAEAAVAHDWLYAVGEAGGREKADAVFRYAMGEQQVNPVKRFAMWVAVRVGGGEAFGRADEWRFVDPATFEPAPQPFAKPERAAVARIDCRDLASEAGRIIAEHGSDPPIELQLTPEMLQRLRRPDRLRPRG